MTDGIRNIFGKGKEMLGQMVTVSGMATEEGIRQRAAKQELELLCICNPSSYCETNLFCRADTLPPMQ
jgi:hypothetical protein